MDFSYVVADSETNLIPATRVFMVGVQDIMSGEYRSYVGTDEVAEAYYRMSTESKIIAGHNFRLYDAKTVGEKIVGITIPQEKIIDTLDMARDLLPKLRNHKLETLGQIIGLPKLKAPLFEEYSKEMDTYCERDVRLNTAALGFLYAIHLQSAAFGLRYNFALLNQHAEALSRSIIV